MSVSWEILERNQKLVSEIKSEEQIEEFCVVLLEKLKENDWKSVNPIVVSDTINVLLGKIVLFY